MSGTAHHQGIMKSWSLAIPHAPIARALLKQRQWRPGGADLTPLSVSAAFPISAGGPLDGLWASVAGCAVWCLVVLGVLVRRLADPDPDPSDPGDRDSTALVVSATPPSPSPSSQSVLRACGFSSLSVDAGIFLAGLGCSWFVTGWIHLIGLVSLGPPLPSFQPSKIFPRSLPGAAFRFTFILFISFFPSRAFVCRSTLPTRRNAVFDANITLDAGRQFASTSQGRKGNEQGNRWKVGAARCLEHIPSDSWLLGRTGKMVNKILAAYVVADILFLVSGAIELAFSIIVGNVMNEVAVDGETAARNLLYQRFPLRGT